jgi:hypothetical protein
MPVREMVTKEVVMNALEVQEIASNTTTVGAIIDTRDYDLGVYFAMFCSAYTDGTYTLKIEHGDDSGLSDAADVPADALVYGTLPALTALTAEGGRLAKEGVFGTKRFLRASIVSTLVTTGADLSVIMVKAAELCPTDQA